MGRKRARKRARTMSKAEEVDVSAHAGMRTSGEAATAPSAETISALEGLAPELLQACVSLLGAEEALPLRGVSRRLRAAFGSVAWGAVEVTARRAAYVNGVAGLVRGGALRLQPHASCTLTLAAPEPDREQPSSEPRGGGSEDSDAGSSESEYKIEYADATDLSERELEENPWPWGPVQKPARERLQLHRACGRLLAACSKAARGLREASVVATAKESGSPKELLMSALRALRPPRAKAAAAEWHPLEAFRVVGAYPRSLHGRSWREDCGFGEQERDADLLYEALAPLGGLRELELPGNAIVCIPGAEAIAEAIPQLRRIAFSTREEGFPIAQAGERHPRFFVDNHVGVCTTLAKLQHLEEVSVRVTEDVYVRNTDADQINGVAACFADGPAGRTLRALRVYGCRGGTFSGEGVRALARMPSLELLAGLKVGPGCTAADLAALGSLPRLRELQVEFSRRASQVQRNEQLSVVPRLSALLAAAAALRSLDLTLECGHDTMPPPAVADAVNVAAPVLTAFTLVTTCAQFYDACEERQPVPCICHRGRPLSEEEARALAACPRLRRVTLRVGTGGEAGRAAYRELAPLRRLGPALELRVAFHDDRLDFGGGFECEDDFDDNGLGEEARDHGAPHRFLRGLFPAARIRFVDSGHMERPAWWSDRPFLC